MSLRFHDPYDVEAADLAAGNSNDSFEDVNLECGVAGDPLPAHEWDESLRNYDEGDPLAWAERVLRETEERWFVSKYMNEVRTFRTNREMKGEDWGIGVRHGRGPSGTYAKHEQRIPAWNNVCTYVLELEAQGVNRQAARRAAQQHFDLPQHDVTWQTRAIKNVSPFNAVMAYLADLYGQGIERPQLIELANRMGFPMDEDKWRRLSRHWNGKRARKHTGWKDVPKHNATGYGQGCRCPLCKRAKADYRHKMKQKEQANVR